MRNFKIRDLSDSVESRSAVSDMVNVNAIERFRDWITTDAEIHIGERWFLSESNCSKLTDAERMPVPCMHMHVLSVCAEAKIFHL